MGSDMLGSALPWVDAIATSFPVVDIVRFHSDVLPGWARDRGDLITDDIREIDPVTFVGDHGVRFTWRSVDGRLVVDDDEADTVVLVTDDAFSEFVNELLTANGAVRTGRAHVVRGDLAAWQRWEPALRSLQSGREIYGPQVWATLVDRGGEPLDLTRRFRADDDADEMQHFLETAGYLHVAAVFTPEEVARLGDEVEHVRTLTTPGDPFSWWSVNAEGEEVVTRINYLDRHSDEIRRLCFDERLARFARLASASMRVCDDRLDGPMVFVKNSGVVKGNGDLGWHVDDGIGGHPVLCPLIQCGVQLDHANAENGQLMVLAGSHRYTKHWYAWGTEDGLPVVALDTEPGDLTLHFGDTMHTTPPPTGDHAGRRALYVKFSEPHTFDWVPAGCHYNDALFRRQDDGRLANRAATWAEDIAR
jgi:ectoine hydroxylase-related dioxygenase (phytanoyl-CoA dioxygenase family)